MDETPTAPDEASALEFAVLRQLRSLNARSLASGLYVVATPIGNLGDITLRALATLAGAEVLYCEDTRHSCKLLDRYGIRRALRSLHDHNEQAELNSALDQLATGRSLALISDAGTPLVSDPGFKLVRACLEAGHKVYAIPGPSAALAALCVSGLPSDCFAFVGFLPPKSSQRLERLRQLGPVTGTLIFFEAPDRLEAMLADLAASYGPDCPAAVARELTKLYEENRRGTLAELGQWAGSTELRGEYVVLVAPTRATDQAASDEDILAALDAAAGPTQRDRIDAVARQLHAPRKRVYSLALRSRKD